MRLEIRVQPSASVTSVGGSYDGALVVRVVEPPERGRATTAALRAVADALGVPRRSVVLLRGPTSRRKVIEVRSDHEDSLHRRLTELLSSGSPAD